MTEPHSSPAAAELAAELAAALSTLCEDIILCPGSRNAPLSLALLAQQRAGRLRVHTRIDERGAAFSALGMARLSRRPVAVVMTSGTAVANTLPAVIEAAYSHTPLLIISADRPRRLVGTGASQTIDQVGIFGHYAPTRQITELADIAPAVAQLPLVAHLNIAFDNPLVGSQLPQATPSGQQPVPWQQPWVDHGEVGVDLSKNTLVIAGDEAWEVPGLEDVPTIAEPTAPAPYRPVHPLAAHLFLRQEVSSGEYIVRTRVEQVIVVGHPTLHRGVLALIADPQTELISLSRTADFTNPRGEQAQLGTRVRVSGEPTREWIQICEAVATVGADAVRDVLEESASTPDLPVPRFSGLHAAAAVADTLAVGDYLFIGASNPVRDLSFVGLPFDGVASFAARGAAGIDGSVSQAIGLALAAQAREADAPRAPRTVALLGDITFLHDAMALALGPDQRRPENLTIVVANDHGGGIFETLEVGAPALRGEGDADFQAAFGTPHQVDIAQLCEAVGVEYHRADSAGQLLEILSDLAEYSTGMVVVEAATSRDGLRELHAMLRQRVGG